MLKRIVSIILIFSIINLSFTWICPSICFARISPSEIDQLIDEFDKNTEKVVELQQSFYKRNKWKLIAAGVTGVAVATVIIFGTWGAGTAPAITAGVGTMKFVSATAIGGSTGAAALTTGAVTSGLAVVSIGIYNYAIDNNINMTPELHEKIMNEIKIKKTSIMAESDSKDDALRIMKEIAISVMKQDVQKVVSAD